MFAKAQTVGDTVDYVGDGEYFGLIYKASTHKAYHFLNVVPALCTGGPTYVAAVFGGPHDQGCIDQNGSLYMSGNNPAGELGNGNTTGTCAGCMLHITTDSAGNAIDPVKQILFSGTNSSQFWETAIVTTTGKVGVAGSLAGGMRGNGTNGAASQSTFVWVVFPAGTFIIKITGLYGHIAIDTAGQAWSWGFNNSKPQLGRGTSPSPDYRTPGTITLPTGWRAIDIADAASYGVILLDSAGRRKVLGIGDHPTFWGGASATSSNSPQDFTAFMTSQLTAQNDTSKVNSVYCNNGSIYYILRDSTLWDMGDNACGTIGNGVQADWPNYTFAPAPTGGTPAPYAYDNGYGPSGIGEVPVQTLYHVAAGTHNWVTGYPGISNCWFAHFVNNKGELWGWGRDKAGQLVDSIICCNPGSGGINATYPDTWDVPWPKRILPFSWAASTQVNCLYCYANPGATNCSQCSQVQGSAPTVNAGADQILTAGASSATLSGSSQAGRKVFTAVWTELSGPNTATLPFHMDLSTPVSGLIPGVYKMQLQVTDQFQVSNTSTMQIFVNSYVKPPGARKRTYRQL